ncbi:MAG: hypothetical protein LBI80_02735 [Endomicrobium sp.]|jgi:transposase|nr:hypothetical protein [Endomicrobium sp.]
MKQLHKKFNSEQVKEILNKYERGKAKRETIQEILGLGRSRFFDLIKKYRQKGINFSIEYSRQAINRKLENKYDNLILNELETSKKLVNNPEVPTQWYNYSYFSQKIKRKYGIGFQYLQ